MYYTAVSVGVNKTSAALHPRSQILTNHPICFIFHVSQSLLLLIIFEMDSQVHKYSRSPNNSVVMNKPVEKIYCLLFIGESA